MEKKSLERAEEIFLTNIQNDSEINLVDKIELLLNMKLILEDYDNAIKTLQNNQTKQKILKK